MRAAGLARGGGRLEHEEGCVLASRIEALYDWIDAHLDEALRDLIHLCRQGGISAQGKGLEEAASAVEELMTGAGLTPRRLMPPGARYPVIYAASPGRSPRTLLFYNHYDVQPPEPFELWHTPPFEPTLAGGNLIARGVADNKGNLVARLLAVRAFRETQGELPVGVKFCVEGEEEIGSPRLGAFVAEHRDLLSADGCIWEGGGVTRDGRPLIVLGLKGFLYVELEARGPSHDVHSSLATIVPNPAWRLVWALSTLKDRDERVLIEGFYDDVRPPTAAELAAADAAPTEEQETRRSLGLDSLLLGLEGAALSRRHLFEPTCTICGLTAGYGGEGSIPSVARAKLDFRLVPDQRPDDILAKLRRHLDRHGFDDVWRTSMEDGEPAARTPLDAAFARLVTETARAVYHKEPVVLPTMAASGPMHLFTDGLGLPVASSGVENPDSGMHAPNEFIRVDDFVIGVKHIVAIMERMSEEPAL